MDARDITDKTTSEDTREATEAVRLPLALTPERAADALGVSPATLAEWRKRYIGPAFVRVGAKHGRVLYKVADLEAFLDDNRVGTDTHGRRGPRGE